MGTSKATASGVATNPMTTLLNALAEEANRLTTWCTALSKSYRAAWPDADMPDDKYLLEVLSNPENFKKFVQVTDFFAASAATEA